MNGSEGTQAYIKKKREEEEGTSSSLLRSHEEFWGLVLLLLLLWSVRRSGPLGACVSCLEISFHTTTEPARLSKARGEQFVGRGSKRKWRRRRGNSTGWIPLGHGRVGGTCIEERRRKETSGNFLLLFTPPLSVSSLRECHQCCLYVLATFAGVPWQRLYSRRW